MVRGGCGVCRLCNAAQCCEKAPIRGSRGSADGEDYACWMLARHCKPKDTSGTALQELWLQCRCGQHRAREPLLRHPHGGPHQGAPDARAGGPRCPQRAVPPPHAVPKQSAGCGRKLVRQADVAGAAKQGRAFFTSGSASLCGSRRPRSPARSSSCLPPSWSGHHQRAFGTPAAICQAGKLNRLKRF